MNFIKVHQRLPRESYGAVVVLDANPLEDIRHPRRIAAVIANGQLFDCQSAARWP